MHLASGYRQDGYRVWFAPGTQVKTGMALIVSNRLAHVPVNVTYRDPTGHTLIATLNILGRLPLALVVSHASPSSDAARCAYFKHLLPHLPSADPKQPDRMGLWMGDFNMEEGSGEATDRQSARGAMLRSYAAVCTRLGSAVAGGLEDAHAIVHGGRPAPTSAAGRSIDRILVDPRMVGGVPGLVGAAYVSRHLLRVKGRGGLLRKAPDHDAVGVTARLAVRRSVFRQGALHRRDVCRLDHVRGGARVGQYCRDRGEDLGPASVGEAV